jgi:hypothetical protein
LNTWVFIPSVGDSFFCSNGITCTNIAGLGQSIKVYNTSGAAAVVASVGAVLLALVVMFASL